MPIKTTPKLTAANSNLYLATKPPSGGDCADAGAKSIRFRAFHLDHAEHSCMVRDLRLDGLHIASHRPDRSGWHIRASSENAAEKCFHLYYFKQLIDTSKGTGSKARFKFICEWLTDKGATPNSLCVADAPNPSAAIKKYAP